MMPAIVVITELRVSVKNGAGSAEKTKRNRKAVATKVANLVEN